MLECVVNISEGRRADVVAAIAGAAGAALLDVHSDPWHHRSVLTLAGPDVEVAARAVAREAVARLDLRQHQGAHPRLGVVDVVPFVPLSLDEPAASAPAPEPAPAHAHAGPTTLGSAGGSGWEAALGARERFAGYAGGELGLPCFFYGPERSLPEVRRGAFSTLDPDAGPGVPHPTAGACCVGVRPVLVAYNLWLDAGDDPGGGPSGGPGPGSGDGGGGSGPGSGLALARQIARRLRSPAVRALAFDLGGEAQVSCNLLDPLVTGPAEVYDAVAAVAPVRNAELVGLLPRAVLDGIDPARWAELDLSTERTIEARLDAAGLSRSGPRAPP